MTAAPPAKNAIFVMSGMTAIAYARSSSLSGMYWSRDERNSSSTWLAISRRPCSRACAKLRRAQREHESSQRREQFYAASHI